MSSKLGSSLIYFHFINIMITEICFYLESQERAFDRLGDTKIYSDEEIKQEGIHFIQTTPANVPGH